MGRVRRESMKIICVLKGSVGRNRARRAKVVLEERGRGERKEMEVKL